MKYLGLIISMFFMLQARSNDMVITYGDFLLLSPNQKAQTIELIREFMIEFENEQILGEYQSLKKKKRYQVYQKILNFMIDQAYAEDQNHFDMSIPAAKNGKDPCIFAGSISQMEPRNGQYRCANPFAKKTTFKDAADQPFEYAGNDAYVNYHYEDAIVFDPHGKNFSTATKRNKKCSSKDSAICSPDVFGKIEGKPICINIEYDGGFNTTFACNKAIEEIKTVADNKFKIDSKDTGYTGTELADQMMQEILNKPNGTLAPALHMVADVCLCGKNANNQSKYFSNPDGKYAEFASQIFGSNTCVGLLTQMQRIADEAVNHVSCKEEVNYGHSKEFFNWYLYAKAVSEKTDDNSFNELIKAGANNGIRKREEIFLGMAEESLGSYLETQKSINEKLYGNLADETFEQAKARNLCPAANAMMKLNLTRDGDKLIVELEAGEEASIPESYSPQFVPISDELSGLPQDLIQYTEEKTTGPKKQFRYVIDAKAKDGVEVKAVATVDGQIIESNGVDLTQNSPTKLTASLDGRKLQLLYESCTGSNNCNHGFEIPEPNIDGLSIEIMPCNEGGEDPVNSTAGQQTLFCADLSGLKNEKPIEVTFKGRQATQSVESNKITIPIAGSDFKISGSKTYLKLESGKPKLYSEIEEATIKIGEEELNLLDSDKREELAKVAFEPGKKEGEEVTILIERNDLAALPVKATYQGVEATHIFPEIKPVCKIEVNEAGAKINIETPDLEIDEGVDFFKLSGPKLSFSGGSGTPAALAPKGDIRLEGSVINIPMDAKSLNQVKELAGQELKFSFAGLQDFSGKPVVCEETKGSDEVKLDGLADNNKCSIEVQKTAFENQMNQQGFRIVASVKEDKSDSDDEESEDEESEYSVKIYDMNRPAAKETKKKKKKEDLKVVIDDSEEDEKEKDSEKKKEKTRAVAGLEDSVKDIDKKRVISSSGTTVMPRRSEAYTVRVVAFRNGVACGVENVEVPVRKADNSNPVQAPMPSGFAPTGGKTFREGI